MLVERERELDELNSVLNAPAARLLAVSGRRRLGKTTLLVHWAKTSGLPYLYWVGSHFPGAVLLSQFSQQVWQHGNPGKRAPRSFSYDSWSHAFEELASYCQDQQRHIVILDEFPYAVGSEPGLPSALQNAWDHHLKSSNVCVVLCGSPIGMMDRLLGADAPLYGRMLGPLRVRPLPFSATKIFFPRYSAEQRVAVYATLGGVPAYLERFSDELTFSENVKQNLFRETCLFRTDPDYLIGEQVRDPRNYQAVLSAIAEGARQPADIVLAAGLPNRSSVDPYLAQLVEMDYLRRELPVTVPPKKQATSRQARYVLADNYVRFYFRFVRPNLGLLAQELYDEVWQRVADQLRAFIGMTAFEEMCRTWVLVQARAGRLAFPVEQVGAHWNGGTQIDVAAINWREKRLLLGEVKWIGEAVGREVVHDLIDQKAPKVRQQLPDAGEGWRLSYAFFARRGFTEAAQSLAQQHQAYLIDLARLAEDLTAPGESTGV